MQNLQTTQPPGSRPEWLTDAVDVVILAAVLMTLIALL
jgi:hypothetical protein